MTKRTISVLVVLLGALAAGGSAACSSPSADTGSATQPGCSSTDANERSPSTSPPSTGGGGAEGVAPQAADPCLASSGTPGSSGSSGSSGASGTPGPSGSSGSSGSSQTCAKRDEHCDTDLDCCSNLNNSCDAYGTHRCR